jgi:transposase-like protein
MGMKKERSERIVDGKRIFIHPEGIRIEIVKEIENGSLSIKEAMEKYGIQCSGTVLDWLKKYSELYREKYMRVIHPVSDRRLIAYKVESGALSLQDASTRYRVQQETIKKWIKLYTCTTINPDTMSPKEQPRQSSTIETKALQEQIETLKLKVKGLEMLIDIAEKELNIDIRKKPGTKQ